MRIDTDRLRELPEIEVPRSLDALVFERARRILDSETAAPVTLPRTEALVYATSLAAYFAYFLRGARSIFEIAVRMISG